MTGRRPNSSTAVDVANNHIAIRSSRSSRKYSSYRGSSTHWIRIPTPIAIRPTMMSVWRSWMGSSVRLRRATANATRIAATGTVHTNPPRLPFRVTSTRLSRLWWNATAVVAMMNAQRRTNR